LGLEKGNKNKLDGDYVGGGRRERHLGKKRKGGRDCLSLGADKGDTLLNWLRGKKRDRKKAKLQSKGAREVVCVMGN